MQQLKVSRLERQLTEVRAKGKHYFIDAAGEIHGECKFWHESGQLHRHCFYVDGELQGEYKLWHENGQIWFCCFYVDGELQGEYKLWFADGQLREHSFYEEGKLQGEYKALTVCGKLNAHSFLSVGLDITAEVKSLVADINCITSEDRLLIKLRYGIECLPELE